MMRNIASTFIILVLAAPALAGFGHGGGADAGSGIFSRAPGTGSEFRVTESTAGTFRLNLSGYATNTTGIQGNRAYFQSFCVETGHRSDSSVRMWLSTEFTDGGPGAHSWQQGHEPLGTTHGNDLSSKTAWLYSEFARGHLAGYNYGSGGFSKLSRSETAGALQRLIWAAEEVGGQNFTETFQGIWLNADQRALIQSWEDAYSRAASGGWAGIGDVRVLQTVDEYGSNLGQDVLVLIVPTPAATPLAVMGLSLLTMLRRR